MSDSPFSPEGAVIDLTPRLALRDVDRVLRHPRIKKVDRHKPTAFCVACAITVCEKTRTETRTVECSRCGRQWDPIAAIVHLARTWDNAAAQIQRLRAETKRLAELRDELRREVANLKAKKKRAGGAA